VAQKKVKKASILRTSQIIFHHRLGEGAVERKTLHFHIKIYINFYPAQMTSVM